MKAITMPAAMTTAIMAICSVPAAGAAVLAFGA